MKYWRNRQDDREEEMDGKWGRLAVIYNDRYLATHISYRIPLLNETRILSISPTT
jgi:hypothetical protein